jgi:uncharacterized protein
MSKEFNPQRLDVRAFAEAQATLSDQVPLSRMTRLAEEAQGRELDRLVSWSVRGELREAGRVHPQPWLHLTAEASLSLTCQRCLTPVDVPVAVDNAFRFVPDEATAEAEDDEAEEDVLALSRQFDLLTLIEDELLMSLPLVPRHDECPVPVRLHSGEPEADDDVTAAHSNPFAVLGQLKKPGTGS